MIKILKKGEYALDDVLIRDRSGRDVSGVVSDIIFGVKMGGDPTLINYCRTLDGADITSSDFAAIYVRQADKVFVTVQEGTVNTLTNGGNFTPIDENDVDAVIYAKDDLTINGSGALTINKIVNSGNSMIFLREGKNVLKNINTSDILHLRATCDDAWEIEESDAVTIMGTISGGGTLCLDSGLYILASGAQLNNTTLSQGEGA